MPEKSSPKVAIVTGAGKGIGRAVCVELAARGYFLIVNYRFDQAGAAETLERVRAEGADGQIVQFDVTDFQAVQTAIGDISAGFETIDVLVNNAGITGAG